MQRLFERIADHFDGTVEAEEVRGDYLRIVFKGPGRTSNGAGPEGFRERVEIFPYDALDAVSSACVPLVRVQHPDDGEPVLVTPVPSAIIAVALR